MSDGLAIDKESFKKLPTKEQLTILYENTEWLKIRLTGFKFQQKIQWAIIIALFILTGFGKYLGVL